MQSKSSYYSLFKALVVIMWATGKYTEKKPIVDTH